VLDRWIRLLRIDKIIPFLWVSALTGQEPLNELRHIFSLHRF